MKISPWYYVVRVKSSCGMDDLYGTIEDGKAVLTFSPDQAERFSTRKKAEKFMKGRLYMYSNPKRVIEMFDLNVHMAMAD
jgi:hypothetical protein